MTSVQNEAALVKALWRAARKLESDHANVTPESPEDWDDAEAYRIWRAAHKAIAKAGIGVQSEAAA